MARADAAGVRIAVRLAWSPGPGRAVEVDLVLPAGATLRDALVAGGLSVAAVDAGPRRVGVWGRLRPLEAALADGDRVEVYRPLQVEPMEARRARARRDAARVDRKPRGAGPRAKAPTSAGHDG